MELIPSSRADETEDVAGRGCDNGDNNCGGGIKWLTNCISQDKPMVLIFLAAQQWNARIAFVAQEASSSP